MLASARDEREAERAAAILREDGEIAIVRPDEGVRLAEWMRHTRPLVFGDRLSVCFAWSEHDRSQLPNLIELGLGGFGNGAHPTTRMLIELLIERIRGGERVLDVGCGSGVVGLCALTLGAASVIAVDVKRDAVEAARRNAELNGVADRIETTCAPLSEVNGEFDVVLANIGRGAIIELAPDLVRLVGPSGWLAVSGFSPTQASHLATVLRPLDECDRRTTAEWSAVLLEPIGGGPTR